ncbi:MAG: prephenate dehydratase [Acetobacterales bacterium]
MPDPDNTISFQGVPGAYSDLACREVFPRMQTLPCKTFEDAFAAVSLSRARHGMIPIENSVAGRVADIHHLLPDSGLYIVGEHFQRVNHQLVAPARATLNTIKRVHSHQMALSQCRNMIRELGLEAVVHADTAGAAADVAVRNDPAEAAIASRLAAETYRLQILKSDIEDAAHNTTRFLIMAREPVEMAEDAGTAITSFVFRVRNVPAALYKTLGGFATNGVNMTKLESYLVDGNFQAAQFYADIVGHPATRLVKLAMEELRFFSSEVKVLGTYPAHPYREECGPPVLAD